MEGKFLKIREQLQKNKETFWVWRWSYWTYSVNKILSLTFKVCG